MFHDAGSSKVHSWWKSFVLLWNLTVHYCSHIHPMLSCLNLLYNFTPYSLLTVSRFPRDLFCWQFKHLLWLVHVPLHLISLTVLHEAYKLCNFSFVAYFLLVTTNFLTTEFQQLWCVCVCVRARAHARAHVHVCNIKCTKDNVNRFCGPHNRFTPLFWVVQTVTRATDLWDTELSMQVFLPSVPSGGMS